MLTTGGVVVVLVGASGDVVLVGDASDGMAVLCVLL